VFRNDPWADDAHAYALCKVNVRRASLVLLASGLVAIAVVSVSAARSTSGQGHLEVTARTDHHALGSQTLDCAAGAANGRLCGQVLRLVRSYPRTLRERCLQIWGGSARARITWAAPGASVKLSLNRANSCEIHRWNTLARLLPRP
jgi:hypothetical protein